MSFIATLMSLAWIHDHWKLLVGIIVGIIILRAIIRDSRRAPDPQPTQPQQPAADPAPPAPAAEENEPPKPKPIKPPMTQNGYCLSYYYPDVQFDVLPVSAQAAKDVPLGKPIILTVDEETNDVFLNYNGETFGRMRNNLLRSMVHDFNTDERTILALSVPWDDTPIFGLAFYDSFDSIREKWESYDDYREFSLTGNTNDEMQTNISFTDPGTPITFFYDYEKDKHMALADGFEIGFCSVGAEKYIVEHSNIEARVLSVEENDSGNYAVRIMVITK